MRISDWSSDVCSSDLGDTVPVGASAYPATGSARSTTPPVTNPDKICYLAFTSGTTGQPKGVMHSDNTLLAHGRAMVRAWNPTNATKIGRTECGARVRQSV